MAEIDKTNDLSDLVVDKEAENKKDDNKKKIIIIVASVVIIALIVIGIMQYTNVGFGSGDESTKLSPPIATPMDSTPKEPIAATADNLNVNAKDDLVAADKAPVNENIDALDTKKNGTNDLATDEPVTPDVDAGLEPKTKEPKVDDKMDTIVDDLKDDINLDANDKNKANTNDEIALDEPSPVADIANTSTSVNVAAKKANLKKGYYIQVNANQRLKPSKKFMEKLKEDGYNVHLLDVSVNGVKTTRVLVGPYASKNEAKDILQDVREKSSREDAFVYYIK